jgi:hypothetical protein
MAQHRQPSRLLMPIHGQALEPPISPIEQQEKPLKMQQWLHWQPAP